MYLVPYTRLSCIPGILYNKRLIKYTINNFIKSCYYHEDAFCPNLMRGIDYLKTADLNKGLAFTMAERQTLGIQGLLAGSCKTQQEQLELCAYSLDRYTDALDKYLYLTELQDTNERLFYELINTNVEKYLPIVYTSVVGLACSRFGLVYRRPRGLFLTIKDKGRLNTILRNWPENNVRAIVVTDGERILGLGDLGAYGMGVPVGKLTLYTILGGVPPTMCLPITLDVGTNNQNLLEDPMYIGVREKRSRGEEFDEFVDEFMKACVKRYSHAVIIQFEDFGLTNAIRLLAKYQNIYCTFNGDIQGTGAVAVAGILAASRITKKKMTENIFLFMGSGSAGTGIANLLTDELIQQGISKEEAVKKIFMFDIDGLLTTRRQGGIPQHAAQYGKDLEPEKDFAKLVKILKPTCLIGVASVAGAFTPSILKQMATNCERPMILALSNPISRTECTPEQAYEHTEGRAIYAAGSPFPPNTYKGKEYHTGQCNNAYIYPGVALGVLACYAHHVPDVMFLAAAETLASNVSQSDLDIGRIYPSINDVRKLSYKIAEAVVEIAYKLNLASIYPKPKDTAAFVKSYVYQTNYSCYVPDYYEYSEPTGIKVKSIKEMIEAVKSKKKA